ncbi:MAG: cytochrome c biogenesis CcdA family protein [Endomicrobiaceae bacterium]
MISYIQNIFANGSLITVMFAVAAAGAAASLSSCTIARLPVVLGYVAAASESKRKGIMLSFAFACGLILSYTAAGFLLGFITDFAGKLIHISRFLYSFLGIALVVSGLFFAGLIPGIKKLLNTGRKTESGQAKTIPSAFIFGIMFAFLEMPACPCCGAVLMVIASFVVLKGSLIYSGLVFFSFAAGQSLPILVIGLSTGILKNLVKKTEKLENIIAFAAANILVVTGVFLLFIA